MMDAALQLLLTPRRRRIRLISPGAPGVLGSGAAFSRPSPATYTGQDGVSVLPVAPEMPRFQGLAGFLPMEGATINFTADSDGLPVPVGTNTVEFSGEAPAKFVGRQVVKHVRGADTADTNCGAWATIRGGSYNTTFTYYRWVYVQADSTATAITFGLEHPSGGLWGAAMRPVAADMARRNVWQRLAITVTTASSGSSPSNPGLVLRMAGPAGSYCYSQATQFELGAIPSSYVPTAGAPANRAMEVLNCVIPAAQRRGTVVGRILIPADVPASAYLGLFCLDSGGNTNRSYIAKEVGGNTIVFGRAGTGGGQFNMATIQPGVPFGYAIGWDVETGAVRASIAGSPVQGFTGTTAANRFLPGNGHPGLNSPAWSEYGAHDLYPGVLLPDPRLQALALAA
ncbi:hypothetical protein VQH23_07340 [Pararoseomonas sp. SCSIO 73927]|uniref:phage head spike fiber domain-containing protein n=1 Tax=Pararoseomonas sp. SCSIO 73927 TaxID=3114537 RepID=UPI0030D2B6BC